MAREYSFENPTHEQQLGDRIDTALFDLGVGELFVSDDLVLTAIGKDSRLLEVRYLGGSATYARLDTAPTTSDISSLPIVGYTFKNTDTGWQVSELVDHPITDSVEACQYSATPEPVIELLERTCADATLVARERARVPLTQRLQRAATKLGVLSLPARTSLVRFAAAVLQVPNDALPSKTDS